MPLLITTRVTCKHCCRSFRVPRLSRKDRNTLGVLASETDLFGGPDKFVKVTNFLFDRMYPSHIVDWLAAIAPPTHRAQIEKFITNYGEPPLEFHDITEIIRHITSPPGVCHHCRSALDDPGVSDCPNCQALNIDW